MDKTEYAILDMTKQFGTFLVVELPTPDAAGTRLIRVTPDHPHQRATREEAEALRTELEGNR